jgi:hypothetical protein
MTPDPVHADQLDSPWGDQERGYLTIQSEGAAVAGHPQRETSQPAVLNPRGGPDSKLLTDADVVSAGDRADS